MTREECMAQHPSHGGAAVSHQGTIWSGEPDFMGRRRKYGKCSCGKRLSGWSMYDVIRRLDKHVEESC